MYNFVNHPDVARVRGTPMSNPWDYTMYNRGGVYGPSQDTYSLGGFTSAYGSPVYGRGYGSYAGYGGGAACNCPGQICCKAGECVNTITACPEFEWSGRGNRFRNPIPQHLYTNRPPASNMYSPSRAMFRRKKRKKKPTTVLGMVLDDFGFKKLMKRR